MLNTTTKLRQGAYALAMVACVGAPALADSQITTVGGATLGIYGLVQLDGAWENHRGYSAPGNNVVWAQTGNIAQSGEWNFTADNTRLGFNIAGPDGDNFKLAGKLEFDFYGGGNAENTPVPRLRHGYGTVSFPKLGLSFLAGQSWDVIAPVNVPTVNAGVLYYAGNLGSTRRPQFRATENVTLPGDGKWEITAAVVRSIGQASPFVAASTDAGHDADIPAFEGRTAVTLPLWVEKQAVTLGVSGLYGEEDVLLDTFGNIQTVKVWAGAVDLELPLAKFVSLAGEGFYGGNLDAYQGGIGQGFTKVGNRVINVEGWGGWAALRFKFGPVTANLGGGLDSVHASTVAAGGRTRNTNAFGNVGYNLNGNSKVAFEVERIETDYKAGKSEELWRTQAAYTYSF